ncbi:response regulator [Salinimicrobium oceani]|uniref:Response regulator n=1 Tax=Salinimicrobium oceani TaxID=2722702 RepID=A0ABX1CZR8_9FLAO|nr:response regulator [Salinimicrobium oceani]NJW53757.1 response regulator [Salinimicrobium oceani]
MKATVILIDDDTLVNLINRKMIERVLPNVEIRSFLSAYEALDFFYSLDNLVHQKLVIFIDINMPGMNGWELLDEIEKELPHEHLEIHLLSSSIDPGDIGKAENNALVKSYIIKPLNVEKVVRLGLDSK